MMEIDSKKDYNNCYKKSLAQTCSTIFEIRVVKHGHKHILTINNLSWRKKWKNHTHILSAPTKITNNDVLGKRFIYKLSIGHQCNEKKHHLKCFSIIISSHHIINESSVATKKEGERYHR